MQWTASVLLALFILHTVTSINFQFMETIQNGHHQNEFIFKGSELYPTPFPGIPAHLKPHLLKVQISNAQFPNPNTFIDAVSGCTHLESIELRHVDFRGNFTRRAQLNRLHSLTIVEHELCGWKCKQQLLRNALFFYKNDSRLAIEQITSLGTNVSLIRGSSPTLEINHQLGRIYADEINGELLQDILCHARNSNSNSSFQLRYLEIGKRLQSVVSLRCVDLPALDGLTLELATLEENVNDVLQKATNLRQLELRATPEISDAGISIPPAVARNLKTLKLKSIKFKTMLAEAPIAFSQLEKLDVYETTLHINSIPKELRSLTYSKSRLIGGSLNDLLTQAVMLEELIVYGYGQVDDINLNLLPRATMVSIDLNAVDLVTYSGADAEKSQFQQFTSFQMVDSKLVFDERHPAALPSTIKNLVLEKVDHANASLEYMLAGLTSLEKLYYIPYCASSSRYDQITPVVDLSRLSFKSIRKLKLSSVQLIQSTAVAVAYEQLVDLHLHECKLTGNVAALASTSLRELTLKGCEVSASNFVASLENIGLESVALDCGYPIRTTADCQLTPDAFSPKTLTSLKLRQVRGLVTQSREFESLKSLDVTFGELIFQPVLPSSLESLILYNVNRLEGVDFCKIFSTQQNLKMLEIRDYFYPKHESSFDISCLPTCSLESLDLAFGALTKAIANPVFRSIRSLKIYADRIDASIVKSLSSTFPGVKNIVAATFYGDGATVSYDLIKAIMGTCAIDVAILGVNRTRPGDMEPEHVRMQYDEVEHWFEEHGIEKDATGLDFHRSNLPVRCRRLNA